MALSQAEEEPSPPSADTGAFIGFKCTFDDSATMLVATTAVKRMQTSRQSSAVDWTSLRYHGLSLALKWNKAAKFRGGYMWFRRNMPGCKFCIEGLVSWPPQGFEPRQQLELQTEPLQGDVASRPKPKATPPKPASQPEPASQSAGPQAQNLDSQLSFPQHKALKLIINAVSSRVPGEVSAAEWYHNVGEILGTGTFGTVYKASRRGQDFAVKVMEQRDRNSALQETPSVRTLACLGVRVFVSFLLQHCKSSRREDPEKCVFTQSLTLSSGRLELVVVRLGGRSAEKAESDHEAPAMGVSCLKFREPPRKLICVSISSAFVTLLPCTGVRY